VAQKTKTKERLRLIAADGIIGAARARVGYLKLSRGRDIGRKWQLRLEGVLARSDGVVDRSFEYGCCNVAR